MSNNSRARKAIPTEKLSTVKEIVDSNCNKLLGEMKDKHAALADDIGISVSLFYPAHPRVKSFYSYGYAGPNQQAITPATIFAMGSVTKVFTASLAAWLSANGTIDNLENTLVAPILGPSVSESDYWNSLTLKDLATQTSGMPKNSPGKPSVNLFRGHEPSPLFVDWWNNTNDQNSWLADLNTKWIYSNAGFVTLGFAVVNAAINAGLASNYAQLLGNVITAPLGMNDSFVF
ncbi:MAG: beta-lactamase family protein, partial [Bacteroidia bacterium]|nr:beta-lactamase family protein [Bacteroidia bacterium]